MGLAELVAELAEQYELLSPDQEEAIRLCGSILAAVPTSPPAAVWKILQEIPPLVQDSDPADAAPVLDLLAALVPRHPHPWSLLSPLLEVEDAELAARALDLCLDLLAAGKLTLTRPLLRRFLPIMEQDEDDHPRPPEFLDRLAAAVNRSYGPDGVDGLHHLLLSERDPHLRRLAARLLDKTGRQPAPELGLALLGEEVWTVLGPFISYTRATHQDLVGLGTGRRALAALGNQFSTIVEQQGENFLRSVLATLGWKKLNQGLRVKTLVPLTWPGCAPLFVHPEEAHLFATETPAQMGKPVHLVTARGGSPAPAQGRRGGDGGADPVENFRRLNIVHAELLHELLAVEPLSAAKVVRILDMMDAVVETFHALFAAGSDEYSILPRLWQDLRRQVTDRLAPEEGADILSPELTRLMMAFEDPANLGEVRTVHGLKRFLHQRGLKLGFDIVDRGQNPNQTVDLLLFSGERILGLGPTIRFAELEATLEPDPDPWLPHPVRLAVEGLAWQLLHGNTSWPGLDCFIFGNEVHYYVTFRNHPAFLRVDFSPPQRGGMFDLEYYGVSNYEVDLHPNVELDAIQRFYLDMELDVRRENTRLFVRYDKERCHSLGDLTDKLGNLLRFVPYLMDVDWTIGSLQLPPGGRPAVVAAWARRFKRSGLYPLRHILTENKRQILVRRQAGPTGNEEEVWDGEDPYTDAFSSPPPADLWPALGRRLEELGLPLAVADPAVRGVELPLLALENKVLRPLRRRLKHGQLVVRDGRLELPEARLHEPRHETRVLAELLTGTDEEGHQALAMAEPLSHLERFVPGETTGFVGRLQVERFTLPLCGGQVTAFAARDEHHVIRLGWWAEQDQLFKARPSSRSRWRSNHTCRSEELWALLRSANYTGASGHEDAEQRTAALEHLRRLAALDNLGVVEGLSDNHNRLPGQAAAPGRAVGRAVFGSAGRRPEDVRGSILVTREVQPTDCQFLQKAEGIVSTGGAVLSHAALLAIQFGKPAMVVNGRWEGDAALPALAYPVTRYRNHTGQVCGLPICRRTVDAVLTDRLVEGDLLILDAERGLVRILGQDQHTIALWRGFRMLSRSAADLAAARDPRRILDLRAQLLRARHQIKKAMAGIESAEVAGFALEEILGRGLAGLRTAERAEILAQLQTNPLVSTSVGACGHRVLGRLEEQARLTLADYEQEVPRARYLFEVLGLRLAARHQAERLDLARRVLQGDTARVTPPRDVLATQRLTQLRAQLAERLADIKGREATRQRRHLLRRLRRLDQLLQNPDDAALARADRRQETADAKRCRDLAGRLTLKADECGLESHPLVGWKAANLGEMDRQVGPAVVPPWFAVTDHAFQTILDGPAPASTDMGSELAAAISCGDGPASTLAGAIDNILNGERTDLAAKADLIRRLWQRVPLPRPLQEEVTAACHGLMAEAPGSATEDDTYFALRSSSCDEDSESSMKAGVYDTFLFLRGATAILAHLRRTWAGLWSERALFCRQENDELHQRPACGLIVQRMVRSRVSGVLQTVNVAALNFGELVLSVGLGLGEGIVSGQVAADLVTVVKDQEPGRDPVHINYLTNDKLQQVVFDRRSGHGTRLEDTLYHQRLRPALEYTELCELTRKALALEAVFGYPLDMEFALEEDRLWLLQARPISAIQAQMQITREQAPLPAAGKKKPAPVGAAAHPGGKA